MRIPFHIARRRRGASEFFVGHHCSRMRAMRFTQVAEDAEGLDRLADALEKERAAWRLDKKTEDLKFPSREYRLKQQEEKRRRNVLWENSVSVGRLLCNLRDGGAFDDEPRIKSAV